jgi:NADPH:quinone reductase-like Zn-dependent oxidoreductase
MSRAFWAVAPGEGVLRATPLAPPGEGEARVRTCFSGISRGTESLVFHGRVPASEFARMRCPMMLGAFPFPVAYGYAAVGIVEQGPPALLGRMVFALAPHAEAFVAPAAMLHPIPDGVPPRRAVLAANMETALNILWDAAPLAGERIAVIGAGVVGILAALLLARLPAAEVTLVDRDPSRAAIAHALGVAFAVPDAAPREQELVVHATGNPAGLALALDIAAAEARVLEASWFGDQPCIVPLGGAFHSRRLRLVATQVGQVGGAMRGRRTHAERLRTAMALLDDPRLDRLLDGPTRFDDLPAAMPGILAAPGALCHVVTYPEQACSP